MAESRDARSYRMVAATLMGTLLVFGVLQLLGWVKV